MAQWIIHLEGGPRRVNHAAVAIDQSIFSFGGYCTGGDYATHGVPVDVHVFNTGTLQWFKLPPAPEVEVLKRTAPYQRYGLTVVAYRRCVYLWGGRNDSRGACNLLYKYDPRQNRWSYIACTGDIPNPRDGHTANMIDNRMFIFSGFDDELNIYTKDVYHVDLQTFQWTLVPTTGDVPWSRDFHSTLYLNGVVYMFGGRMDLSDEHHTGEELYSHTISAFDPTSRHWKELQPTGAGPSGRRSHTAWAYNGKMYIIGGYNGIFDLHYNDCFEYNPESNHWQLIELRGKKPSVRRRHCTVLLDDRLYLFGGTTPKFPPLVSVTGESELRDNSDLYVLDYKPSLHTLCLVKVLEYNLDSSQLPHSVQAELRAMSHNSTITHLTYPSG